MEYHWAAKNHGPEIAAFVKNAPRLAGGHVTAESMHPLLLHVDVPKVLPCPSCPDCPRSLWLPSLSPQQCRIGFSSPEFNLLGTNSHLFPSSSSFSQISCCSPTHWRLLSPCFQARYPHHHWKSSPFLPFQAACQILCSFLMDLECLKPAPVLTTGVLPGL